MQPTNSKSVLLDHILKHSLDLICTIDRDGRFYYCNEAFKSILDHDYEYLAGKKLWDFIHPYDQEKTNKALIKVYAGSRTANFENRLIKQNGKKVTVSWSVSWSEEEGVLVCIGRDISEKVKAKRKVREKEDFYQALIEHGSDMLALLDEAGNYKYVGDNITKILGYEPDDLLGKNALTLIHPDDLPKAKNTLDKVLTEGGHVPLHAFRFKNTAEEWIWLETIASNQLDHPSIRGIVVSSRDITEPILNKLKLKENEQRFKALFENNPDMVFFENKTGTVLDVNPAALQFFGVQKDEAVGQNLKFFLSADNPGVCEVNRKEDFAGNRGNFEQEMTISGRDTSGPITLDISKIPVEINGEIVGLYTILRDVTAVNNSQKTIKQQAKKLNNIFESITDAFFTLNTNWNITYLNRECERILGINRLDSVGKSILDVFPEEVNGVFHHKYQYAVETGNSVSFVAFLKRNNIWLEVKAFPFVDGLSVYFADITERIRIEQELEKLSFVASKTSNGVIIQDANGHTEWVNDGFTRITGYTPSCILGKKPGDLLSGPATNKGTIQQIGERMRARESYSGEILQYKKTGEEVWFSLNITPVFDEDGVLTRQVAIFSDITDMVRYRQKLKDLSIVASISTNGIFITDADRRIEWANDGFTRLTGYTTEEVMGKRPSEFLHNERTASEQFKQAKEKMLRGEPVTFEALYTIKGGDEIWVSAEVNSIEDEQGNLTRFIGTLTDITALKKSELELTQLTKDLYRHNRDMQQFTYIVSHNLRSPVANIIGLAKLLKKVEKNSDAFEKGLVNLQKSTTQLDTMLRDMNTILSVKDIKESFHQEEVKLSQVFQQVLESLQEPLNDCGGELALQIPEECVISGKRAYLHSIFFNLLSNSIKYKSAERPLQVVVSCSLNSSGEKVVTFKDNGSGFDMAKVGTKLFKLYNRFHSDTVEGRGMGLFLVKTHVEALGGSIEASSDVNVGTTFTIRFKQASC